eukprot:926436-Rhodomonas_salina.1
MRGNLSTETEMTNRIHAEMQTPDHSNLRIDEGRQGASMTSNFPVPFQEGIQLKLSHRSRTLEPVESVFHKTMGAAVWPCAVAFCEFLPLWLESAPMKRPLGEGGKVIELGSGHGLCGLVCALAGMWSTVVMTDKDTRLVALIEQNCASNHHLCSSVQLQPRHLVWGHASSLQAAIDEFGTFDLVVASDCTYETSLSLKRSAYRYLKSHQLCNLCMFSRGSDISNLPPTLSTLSPHRPLPALAWQVRAGNVFSCTGIIPLSLYALAIRCPGLMLAAQLLSSSGLLVVVHERRDRKKSIESYRKMKREAQGW